MSKVTSAPQATEVAIAFLHSYYPLLAQPKSARREDETWVVEIDIGMFRTRIATVVVDAITGDVKEYQVPL